MYAVYGKGTKPVAIYPHFSEALDLALRLNTKAERSGPAYHAASFPQVKAA